MGINGMGGAALAALVTSVALSGCVVPAAEEAIVFQATPGGAIASYPPDANTHVQCSRTFGVLFVEVVCERVDVSTGTEPDVGVSTALCTSPVVAASNAAASGPVRISAWCGSKLSQEITCTAVPGTQCEAFSQHDGPDPFICRVERTAPGDDLMAGCAWGEIGRLVGLVP